MEGIRMANYNEQYSRGNNVKVFGLPELEEDAEKKRDLTKVFCDKVNEKTKLNILPSDIVAAHRIPGRDADSKPRPVIVQFLRKSVRTSVMRKSKELGNTMKCTDDVTSRNVGLIKRLESNQQVDKAWYFNGHVYAKVGHIQKKVDLFENVAEIFRPKYWWRIFKFMSTMSTKKKKSSCHHGPTNTYQVSTPIGMMELVSCPKGLHYMSQTDESDETFNPDSSVEVMVTSQMYQDNGYTYKPLLLGVDWLRHYFRGQHKGQVSPTICSSVFKEGSFTEKVWKTLPEKVKFGQSVSYKELANMAGNIKACRAVGAAMRSNPIQLIIPCHRVLPEEGGIGNYSGGRKNKMKLWLLEHEGVIK